MLFERLAGPNGNIPVLIRDDDTNFFTKTKMLESVYSKAWNEGFKVCLSVVPLQRGINDICVPPEMRTTGLLYSIDENRDLIYYLKGKIHDELVEVLQHGLSHDYAKGARGEFGINCSKKDNIKLGMGIIKKAFEVEPSFFVPPGEDVSKQNLKASLALGMIPVYRHTFFDRFLRHSFIPDTAKQTALKIFMSRYNSNNNKIQTLDEKYLFQFVKPVIISVGKCAITWSLPKIIKSANLTSFESLFKLTSKVIEYSIINRNPVCIINHYHLYYYDWSSSISRNDLLKAWKQILISFDKLKFAWKVSFSELYDRVKRIQDIQIVKTGSKITIQSNVHIQDFSFRSFHSLEPNASVMLDRETKILTIKSLQPQTKIILYEKT